MEESSAGSWSAESNLPQLKRSNKMQPIFNTGSRKLPAVFNNLLKFLNSLSGAQQGKMLSQNTVGRDYWTHSLATSSIFNWSWLLFSFYWWRYDWPPSSGQSYMQLTREYTRQRCSADKWQRAKKNGAQSMWGEGAVSGKITLTSSVFTTLH